MKFSTGSARLSFFFFLYVVSIKIFIFFFMIVDSDFRQSSLSLKIKKLPELLWNPRSLNLKNEYCKISSDSNFLKHLNILKFVVGFFYTFNLKKISFDATDFDC